MESGDAGKIKTLPVFIKLTWAHLMMSLALCKWVNGFQDYNATVDYNVENYGVSATAPLMVGFTLINGAAAKGAVCLDGTLPGYHFHRGYGSGADSWLISLEGGGWCNSIRACVYRKKTRRGSSTYMEKQIPFTGILSNKAEENPDFFNWNRVKIRYCDGASFSGDSQNKLYHVIGHVEESSGQCEAQLYFRGQRIWSAAIDDLMSKGMRHAKQALLSGCSAGGLASILHCDEFRELFPRTTGVKCLSDGGLFLDVMDIAGRRTARNMFGGVVSLQRVKNLPWSCTKHLSPILCIFPQHLIASIKTPLFLLNAAYDTWQIQVSIAPPAADPHGNWHECRKNYARCTASQIRFLQGFRNQMVNAVKGLAKHRNNGIFINSCFAHCQTERQDTWFAKNSPRIGNKRIAESVGDWYFDRVKIKAIGCAYPCDNTCHNLVFRGKSTQLESIFL